MKSNFIAQIACMVLAFSAQLSNCLAQGSLTPPGPPGATMLTLSQIQPRTPISSVPFTIASPGSYYLTTNLVCTVSNAITISANGVLLDLNGFTISSTVANAANGGKAILLNGFNGGLNNIAIANGFIQGGVTNNGSGVYFGSGFAYGIDYSGASPANIFVSRISISGGLDFGINVGLVNSTTVDSCTVRTVGSTGIEAGIVKQSFVIDCGGDAIFGYQVSDSQGQSTGGGNGVFANSIAENCFGSSAGYIGVNAYTAENCIGYSSGSYAGVDARYTALNCYGSSNAGDGVDADTAENCCGICLSGSNIGINALTAQNCYGYSAAGFYGIYVSCIASGCYGYCTSGTGIFAFIADVCHGGTSTGTALSTTHNVNSY